MVRKIALRKTVEVDRMASGKPIRAMVSIQGSKDSINKKILRKGLGWVREAYCEKAKLCGRLIGIEGKARREQRNLWAAVPENQAAWQWVKEQENKP